MKKPHFKVLAACFNKRTYIYTFNVKKLTCYLLKNYHIKKLYSFEMTITSLSDRLLRI